MHGEERRSAAYCMPRPYRSQGPIEMTLWTGDHDDHGRTSLRNMIERRLNAESHSAFLLQKERLSLLSEKPPGNSDQPRNSDALARPRLGRNAI